MLTFVHWSIYGVAMEQKFCLQQSDCIVNIKLIINVMIKQHNYIISCQSISHTTTWLNKECKRLYRVNVQQWRVNNEMVAMATNALNS